MERGAHMTAHHMIERVGVEADDLLHRLGKRDDDCGQPKRGNVERKLVAHKDE